MSACPTRLSRPGESLQRALIESLQRALIESLQRALICVGMPDASLSPR
jgi:hypothetical protein